MSGPGAIADHLQSGDRRPLVTLSRHSLDFSVQQVATEIHCFRTSNSDLGNGGQLTSIEHRSRTRRLADGLHDLQHVVEFLQELAGILCRQGRLVDVYWLEQVAFRLDL